MELTLKLGEVLNINQVVKAIIDGNNDVDAILKFKLLGIMKNLEFHVTNYEIVRNDKIKEYGKTNEDGSIFIPEEDEEGKKKFIEDMDALVNSDVVLNIEKLNAKNVFNKGVAAEYLMHLSSIIEV